MTSDRVTFPASELHERTGSDLVRPGYRIRLEQRRSVVVRLIEFDRVAQAWELARESSSRLESELGLVTEPVAAFIREASATEWDLVYVLEVVEVGEPEGEVLLAGAPWALIGAALLAVASFIGGALIFGRIGESRFSIDVPPEAVAFMKVGGRIPRTPAEALADVALIVAVLVVLFLLLSRGL